MRTLVFASGNAGKVKELEGLLGAGWTVKSAKDFPALPDVVEDADTFEGNAAKKAHTFAKATGTWAVADDSGLVVDALGGAPGVYSARYAPTESERIDRLLGALTGVEQRSARFVCVLCLAAPDGREFFARGTCEGTIGFERKGNGGFGYDPVFMLPSGKSMAELTKDEKSAISHRGNAFRALLPTVVEHAR